MRKVLIATAFGVVVTFALLGLAFAADATGHPDIARVLFWHNSILQSLIPLNNIGTPAHPVYEGTPLNLLAFYTSIPLGFLIYGVATYIVLNLMRRDT